MMSLPQLTEILVDIELESKNAILVNDGSNIAWLPRSHIEIARVDGFSMARVTLPLWLAKEKRLI